MAPPKLQDYTNGNGLMKWALNFGAGTAFCLILLWQNYTSQRHSQIVMETLRDAVVEIKVSEAEQTAFCREQRQFALQVASEHKQLLEDHKTIMARLTADMRQNGGT